MGKKNFWNRFMSAALACAMVMTSSPVTTFATGLENEQKQGTEITAVSDDSVNETSITEETDITKETKEAQNEQKANDNAKAEEETVTIMDLTAEDDANDWRSVFEENQSIADADGLDFASQRLIVGTEDKSAVIDTENILSDYNGVYLLQYASEADAKLAYGYYLGKVDFVEPDVPVSVAEGEQNPTGDEAMTENANPISELAEAVDGAKSIKANNVIALIDTGVTADNSVVERVSMVGDDASDTNGHGDKMKSFILEQNKDAKILSVKAIGDDGKGNISSVYAGIKYAIEQKVDVINLSLYAKSTAENAALKDVIKEAVDAGIIVVGAAGNDGKNVKYYTPGNIEEAMIIGAADENGQRIASSNFGDTVDYNVVAESTSEASAKMSGYLTAHGKAVDMADVNGGMIFATNFSNTIADTKIETETDGEHTVLKNVRIVVNGTKDIEMNVEIEREEGETEDDYLSRVDFLTSSAKNGNIYVYTDEKDTDSFFKTADTEKGKIGAGAAITYGGAGTGVVSTDTRKFPFTVGNKTYIAFCCDPNHMPLTFAGDETFTANEVTNKGKKRALFYTSEGPGWDTVKLPFSGKDKTLKQYYEDNLKGKAPSGYEWNEVVFTHLIVSKIYEDDSRRKEWTDGIEGDTFATLRSAVTAAANAISNASNPSGFDNYKVFMLDEGTYQRHVYGHGALIRVYKIDKNTEDPLSGAVFTLKKGNKVETTLTSGSDGYTPWYCIEDDEDYTIEETTAPAGYEINGSVKDVKLADGKDHTYTYKNQQTGYVYVQKTTASGYETLVAGNSNYSLAGATFDIYESDQTTKIGTLTTDVNGKTGNLQVGGTGTYYAKEVTAPKGYLKDTAWHSVTVTSANTASNPAQISVADVPAYAVDKIKLTKQMDLDSLVNPINRDPHPIKDAQYTVTFTTVSGKSWVIKTDENGLAVLRNDGTHLVSGSSYVFGQEIRLPLGTVTVQESYAPNGYEPDTNTYTATITQSTNGGAAVFKWQNTTGDFVNKGNEEIRHEEDPLFAGVKAFKKDLELNETNPQGDGSLAGIHFEIRRDPDASDANQKSFGPDKTEYYGGDVVVKSDDLVTDEEGNIVTKNNALQVEFNYVIQEVATNGSYLLTDGQPKKLNWISKDKGGFANVGGQIVDALGEDNSFKNRIRRGGIHLFKADAETKAFEYIADDTEIPLPGYTPQGDATIEGISFAIVNRSITKTMVNGVVYQPGQVVEIITTDKNGEFLTDPTLLPYGTYDIIEQRADSQVKVGDVYDELSDELGTSIYANLMGISSADDHEHGSMLYAANRERFTIREDGEITGEEQWDNGTERTHYENTVARGGFEAYKVDKETMISYALGGATLEGMKFELINRSEEPVYVVNAKYPEGHMYMQGEVIDDETTENAYFTTDKYGRVFSSDHYLPYGTYELKEIETNRTYLFNDKEPRIFHIREEGVVVGQDPDRVIRTREEADGTQLLYANPVIRTDFKFQKKDNNSRAMKNIPWLIRNTVTGETHFILTDNNGEYVSRTDKTRYSDGQDQNYEKYAPHTLNTNAYDEVLSQYVKVETNADGEDVVRYETIPQDVIDALVEQYDYRVGTWFGLSQDVLEGGNDGNGTMAEPDDEIGAFPYGTYTLVELPCDANKKFTMVTDTFNVTSNEKQIDFGTIDNRIVTLRTTAQDADTESHKGISKKDAKIIDRVDYQGLDTDATYKMVAELHYSKELNGRHVDGGIITDADGNEVRVEKEFVPENNDFHIDMELVFNATTLTVGGEVLEKGHTVVCEYLYQIQPDGGETFVKSHEDPEDREQIVDYPFIDTTAVDEETGLHIGFAREDLTIIDRVYYTGLNPSIKYTVDGTLMDKETGEPALDDDGNVIRSEPIQPFTPDESGNGYVDIKFVFKGVSLAGKSVVAFEDLGTTERTYAVHHDINDDDQTVVIPKITTEAKDKDTQCHVGKSSDPVFYDTMKYENLIPGYTYVAQGSLVNKDTGEALDIVSEPKEFTPDEPNGEIELEFDLTGKNLQGVTLVAMEECYLKAGQGKDPFNPDSEELTKPDEDTLIAEHKDPEDEAQSVHYPDVTTNAKDGLTADHVGTVTEKTTVTDVVTMTNLVPGETYQVKGTLHKKGDAGDPIATVESEQFVAEASEQQLELTFEVDSSLLAGTTVVAFEKLYYINPELDINVEVANHEDPDDEDQSVHYPKIWTTAVDKNTGDHSGSLFGKAINAIRALFGGDAEEDTLGGVNDEVFYENLIPGVEYTLRGVLMDKETQAPVLTEEGEEVRAETTFTPDAADGSIILAFEFDTSVLNDHTVVAFEKLFHKNADYQEGDVDEEGNPVDPEVEVAQHEDIEDEDQSVHEPSDIYTTATDETTGSHTGNAAGETVIDDEVVMNNLVRGYTYKLTGTLYDKSTGEPFLDKEGKPYVTTVDFVADDSDENFTETKAEAVDEQTDDQQTEDGTDTGADDTNTDNTDINTDTTDDQNTDTTDEGTTTDTTTEDGNTVAGGDVAPADGEVTTGEDVAPAEETETPSVRINGTVHVRFHVDGELLAGTTVVTFEDLYHNDIRVATHSDIDDPDQSVHYPKIQTHAYDDKNDAKDTQASDKTVVKDLVTYENLLAGKTYTIKGVEMLKSTGEPILNAEGEAVSASATFTPEGEEGELVSGEVILTFEIDTSALAGDVVVAFEKLYINNEPGDGDETEIAHHEDITDHDQSVNVIEIKTHLFDAQALGHDVEAISETKVIDRVTYTGLHAGQKYVIEGELFDKETAQGTGITASAEFTPETPDGHVDLTFTFDGAPYAGKSLVAFEKLYTDVTPVGGEEPVKTEVANHEDINDPDQTINVIEIETNATFADNGAHEGDAVKSAVVIDTVTYKGLTPGQEYTVKGELMNKKTKKGTGITAERTFIPESADGEIELEFKFNAKKYAGKSLVAFEKLFTKVTPDGETEAKDTQVAHHEDLTDADQTVNVVKISTKLVDKKTKKHTATVGEKVTLVDEVSYKGLTPGQKYTVKGTLMDKKTGKSTKITAKKTFTAKKKNGKVKISFTLDTTKYAGKSLVAFERLYDEDGNKIAVHEDIKDKAQTVKVPEKPAEKKTTPGTPGTSTGSGTPSKSMNNVKTGDNQMPMVFGGLALVALAVAVLAMKKKKA